MLLKLKKYNLIVKYKTGTQIYLADMLSRVHQSEVNICDFLHHLKEVDHCRSLAISQDRIRKIQQVSADDPVPTVLCTTIQNGWPDSKSDTPECI